MKKEELISDIGKPILNPLGNLLLLSFLGIISSPFIWIWLNGVLALKIFLTCLISIFFCTWIIKFIKKAVSEVIEQEQKESIICKGSKFKQRLDEVMEQQKKDKEQ